MQALALARDLLGHVVATPRCVGCDARLPNERVFCGPCAATVLPDEVTGPVIAAARFGGAVADGIRRFKFGGRPDLARPLGALLRRALPRVLSGVDLVVPVPLHPARLAERGYNQAALLARLVAPDRRARFAPEALARVVATPQQVGLPREARMTNVAGAFQPRSADLRGARVLLVDDVATTGATLSACALALRDGGAACVTALVVARAEGPLHDGAP